MARKSRQARSRTLANRIILAGLVLVVLAALYGLVGVLKPITLSAAAPVGQSAEARRRLRPGRLPGSWLGWRHRRPDRDRQSPGAGRSRPHRHDQARRGDGRHRDRHDAATRPAHGRADQAIPAGAEEAGRHHEDGRRRRADRAGQGRPDHLDHGRERPGPGRGAARTGRPADGAVRAAGIRLLVRRARFAEVSHRALPDERRRRVRRRGRERADRQRSDSRGPGLGDRRTAAQHGRADPGQAGARREGDRVPRDDQHRPGRRRAQGD